MMLARLKRLERELMSIYAEMQKEVPSLRKISFEIQTFSPGRTYLWGCYHIGNDARVYDNISELAVFVTKAKERRVKNEILYQRFEGVV